MKKFIVTLLTTCLVMCCVGCSNNVMHDDEETPNSNTATPTLKATAAPTEVPTTSPTSMPSPTATPEVKQEDIKNKTIDRIGSYYSKYTYQINLYDIDGLIYSDRNRKKRIKKLEYGYIKDPVLGHQIDYQNGEYTTYYAIDDCLMSNCLVCDYYSNYSDYFNVEVVLQTEFHPEVVFENDDIIQVKIGDAISSTFKDNLKVYFTDGTSITLKKGKMYFK